jgi:putative spermidine/putrescine transport system permease protein
LADAPRRRAPGRRRPSSALLGVVPFFAYTTVFLLIPTLVVVVGAFLDSDNAFTLANVEGLTSPAVLRALRNSVVLSAVTAFAGAVVGGISRMP